MKDKSKLKFISIQSKVDTRTAMRLDEIVERGKFGSRYELMQYILSAFLKVADAENEETELERDTIYMQEVEKMFSGWMDAQNRIITTKPCKSLKLDLVKSIYIYSKQGKKGHVVRELAGNGEHVYVNGSVDNALKETLRLLHPELYARLLEVGKDLGAKNVRVTIERLIAEFEGMMLQHDQSEVSEEFEGYAGTPEYGNKPKQKRTRYRMG